MRCPSDTNAAYYQKIPQYNYAVNLGNTDNLQSATINGTSKYLAGPFATAQPAADSTLTRGVAMAFRDVVDGLSNTMMLGEIRQGTVPPPSSGNPSLGDLRGLVWIKYSTGFTGNQPPNTSVPDSFNSAAFCGSTDDMPCVGSSRRLSMRSRHTGGAHTALCDGSVRFISDSIDLSTMRALSTISGGEVIGEF